MIWTIRFSVFLHTGGQTCRLQTDDILVCDLKAPINKGSSVYKHWCCRAYWEERRPA